MRRVLPVFILIVAVYLGGCKKSETYPTASMSDYSPMVSGKYITYQLDSTVYYKNFGASAVVISYQVKLVVDSLITDALGRPAWRIFRYIRSTPTGAWNADNTFLAVITDNSLEFIENNLRFLKLKEPFSQGYTWKGNAYIDTYSLNSELKYLDDWDYTYDSLNAKITLGAITVDSTIKVAQRDEINGNPADPNSYSERNYGAEKYAKGIGLVYRNFLHTEYQPPANGNPGHFADASYGVRMTMIDHN